jgi:hypothetical protein
MILKLIKWLHANGGGGRGGRREGLREGGEGYSREGQREGE